MTIRLQRKQPGETLNFLHDWAPFLGEDTIASQVTSADGVTVSDVSVETGDQSIKFTIAGGELGTVGTITQTITTAAGLVETETFTIPIAADEPVSLAEVKAYLGIYNDERDAQLEPMIPRARGWVEDYTGLALMQRQFTELRRTEHGAIRLFKAPIASVDSVTYADAAETYTPRLLNGLLVPAVDTSWPTLDEYDAFEITYTAGFDEGTVPDELIGAMLALIEGEFSDGFAYPPRATEAAERCCGMQRRIAV